MGRLSEEVLEIASVDELVGYLRAAHSVYMKQGEKLYYITDANDIYWRVQDTDALNEKGHYTDCSELIPLLRDFVALPFADGKSIADLFEEASFFASIKE